MEIESHAYPAAGLLQFFSFEGRVRRVTFWVNSLVCGVVSFILSYSFVHVSFSFYTMEEQYYISNKPIYYIATILIILRMLSISVRRWQDMNKDGLFAISLFYPVLAALFPNFIFYTGLGNLLMIVGSIVLLVAAGFQGFVPGDHDANSYGPPPEPEQWF